MKDRTKKILFSIMFWVISLTWGIIMTSIGLVVTLGLNLIKFAGVHAGYDLNIKTHRNGCSFITEVGRNWGGLELGAFAICGNYSEKSPSWFDHTRKHEFGHALQHLALGPLFIFIVAIPSACRYWYQRIMQKKGKHFSEDWYDSIWFEGTATSFGTKYIDWLENN
jgi:hypothetical protein